VRLEPTTSVFERAKAVHALDDDGDDDDDDDMYQENRTIILDVIHHLEFFKYDVSETH
jgi:hypothetical protein